MMKNFIRSSNKGSALIIVIVFFTVLILLVAGTMELALTSLIHSKETINKIQTSTAADSAMEYILFYISKAIAQAKRLTYAQFSDSTGRLIYTGDSFENDYLNTFNSYIADFFENKGNRIRIDLKLADNSSVQVSNVSELILMARQSCEYINNIFFSRSGNSYILEVEALDSTTKTKRLERCVFTIPSPFEKVEIISNSSSSNTSSSYLLGWDSNIFDFTTYGLFSSDKIIFNNNITVTTRNMYSSGDITLRNDNNRPRDYTIRADNIIVKNGSFTFEGNNKVVVNNLMYTKNGITFNGNNNRLESNSLLFSDGTISLSGRDEIVANALFCNTLDIKNGSSNLVTINEFAYFNKLNIWTDKMVLKSNSKLFGGDIEIRNNGILSADVGTVVYANNLDIIGSSATIDAPDTVLYCNNLKIDGEVKLNVKKIVCSGTITISNLNSGTNIRVSDKIECRSIPQNIPSGIRNLFVQNLNVNFQIPYPTIPAIIEEIKKNTFPTNWIRLDNIVEDKKDINGANYYSLVSTGQNSNDIYEIFNKNKPNNQHSNVQIFVVTKSGINVPSAQNHLDGVLISNGALQFNGGNLNIEYVRMPQPLIDYLLSKNIIKIENVQPPVISNPTVTFLPQDVNLFIIARHFIVK